MTRLSITLQPKRLAFPFLSGRLNLASKWSLIWSECVVRCFCCFYFAIGFKSRLSTRDGDDVFLIRNPFSHLCLSSDARLSNVSLVRLLIRDLSVGLS